LGGADSRVHYLHVLRLRDRRERHKERITPAPSIGGDALQDQRRKKVPQGKVKWFSTEKAFGFIEQDNDNDIFVHVTGLADGVTAIDKDMLVEYEVEQGRKGPQATNVRPASAPAPAAAVVDATETVEVTETVVTAEDEAGDEVQVDDVVVVTTDEVVVAVEDENGDVALVDEVVVTREEIVAVEDENGDVTVLADEVDVTRDETILEVEEEDEA
jgi:CspA family cold shock protein